MIITIDIGNSQCHIGAFVQDQLVATAHLDEITAVQQWMADYTPTQIVCASVRKNIPTDWLSSAVAITYIGADQALPIGITYRTPHTLGGDRIAAAIGAQALYPHTHCLIIEVGTCITYTLLDKTQGLVGGAITPGLHMRLHSMHEHTEGLPALKLNGYSRCWGPSTHTGMWAGVWQGTQAEIQGMIAQYQKEYTGLQIILSGKNVNSLDSLIKNGTFCVVPSLVLLGLYHFARHL